MPDSSVRTLFVDTSSLRHAGFRKPDFQKLLLRSKAESVRIVVSDWEEWRTYNQSRAGPPRSAASRMGLVHSGARIALADFLFWNGVTTRRNASPDAPDVQLGGRQSTRASLDRTRECEAVSPILAYFPIWPNAAGASLTSEAKCSRMDSTAAPVPSSVECWPVLGYTVSCSLSTFSMWT
jgi:hypothetical protein